MNKRTLLSVLIAGACVAPVIAQATMLKAESSVPYTMKASDLAKKEKELTDFPLMKSVKDTIRTLDNAQVEQIEPGRAANPVNVKRVEGILKESDWEYLFPLRAKDYSYSNFLKAVGKFPALCDTYNDGRDSEAICRKELATMFAHFAHETGGHESWRPEPEWRQALVYVREMGWSEGQKGGYNGECNPDVWQGQTWPCGKDKDGDFLSYFGRGAKQLSYNYNYGPFSEAMYGDVRTLLDKPELVADTWLNLASAIFFFAYPQPPKPSMLQVIDGTWQPNDHDKANGLVPGFGVTTQIINGGVECGGPTEIAQSQNRIKYYKEFANYLKVPVPADEVLGCANMKQFDEGGAGALKIYWEQDWGWSADTPDGKTYACQLVGYQTPFSAFKDGDYTKCVQKFFNVNIVNDDGSAVVPDETPAPAPAPSEDETPAPTPTPDETPAPVPDDIPAVVNHAPVAQIAGPIGAVEAGAQVSLSAEGSTDEDGNKLTYTWRSQDGQTVTGDDKAVVTFNAPEAATAQQYEISLTVSDGELSSTTTYLLNVKAKAATPSQDEGTSGSYPAWSANSKYSAGDIVNNHGKLFQCKPFPYSGWCNNAPMYYEPGAGLAWSEAWTAL
ncbi:glycoside hydrolase family 19 protein [Enterobacter cloacae]|uniref:glycoside hydrolase family 19 protein n=1 Tax=Enterobacter cloacae TaxID=550 RepID=UPI000F848176|nr:glycoside hydrolase family 19 protein [Enterobacter cloacae]MCJ8534739.1 PKD domain-containing protein [Enterobacter cloacae]MCK7217435.1 PKD domain-containing protein [Enterobacter cloacae]MCQ4399535.1 PKD domain-containing protein [Enterobacter cloacae]MCQ4408872.1 PKD domain-containing protein [Enterobacter cloacae]MDK9963558.1 PKD domain-containing protein [Enterobacter cloacae]